MNANIKTWQERTGNFNVRPGSTKHMLAEISELRAALALAQAPSAPVAPIDERAAFEEFWTNPYHGDNSSIEWKTDGYLSFLTREAYRAWQARAALSVKAVSYPEIPEGWQLVPKQSTRAMMDGAFDNISLSDAHSTYGVTEHVWSFMLAAAPTPPTTGEA